MLEFMVPEPAALHRFVGGERPPAGVTATLPPEPKAEPTSHLPATQGLPNAVDLSPKDITSATYQAWAALYRVTGVKPPPPTYSIISLVFEGTPPGPVFVKTTKQLKVPPGYRATKNFTRFSWHPAGPEYLATLVGTDGGYIWDAAVTPNASENTAMNSEDGEIPVACIARGVAGYTCRIEVTCEAAEALAEWQLETYSAVIQAYTDAKAQYDEQIRAAGVAQGVAIRGRNPAVNREIEQVELRRLALSALTGQHFDSFNAIGAHPSLNYPEASLSEADAEGRYIQFFEQAIEWEHMIYRFYPYFWGRKDLWPEATSTTDPDPLFEAFLQAGAARINVPVRPGYEAALLHYLNTPEGQIWNGSDPPLVLDANGNPDPLYVSLLDELKEEQDADPRVADGDPWEVTVPTELVVLQLDSTLPCENGEVPSGPDAISTPARSPDR